MPRDNRAWEIQDAIERAKEKEKMDKMESDLAGGIVTLVAPIFIPVVFGLMYIVIPLFGFIILFQIFLVKSQSIAIDLIPQPVGYSIGILIAIGFAIVFDFIAFMTARKGNYFWILNIREQGAFGFLKKAYALILSLLPWVAIIITFNLQMSAPMSCTPINTFPDKIYERGYYWSVVQDQSFSVPGTISGQIKEYDNTTHILRFQGIARQVIDINVQPTTPGWAIIFVGPDGTELFHTNNVNPEELNKLKKIKLRCNGQYAIYLVPYDYDSKDYIVTISVR